MVAQHVDPTGPAGPTGTSGPASSVAAGPHETRYKEVVEFRVGLLPRVLVVQLATRAGAKSTKWTTGPTLEPGLAERPHHGIGPVRGTACR
jgi:hypothetical protein